MKIFVSAKAFEPKTAPDQIVIFPPGEIKIHGEESIYITEAEALKIIEAFNEDSHAKVIDYEHQTLDGGKAPAAGWISALSWDDERGLIGDTEWTKEASEYIEKGEYRYISPVFTVKIAKGKNIVDYLYNVALTNQPRMRNVREIAAKMIIPNDKTGENNMPIDMEGLRAAVGLPDTAGDEEVVSQAVESVMAAKELKRLASEYEKSESRFKEKLWDLRRFKDALELDDAATESDAIGKILAMKQNGEQSAKAQEELEVLKNEAAKKRVDELLSSAKTDGKITEAMNEWATEYATSDPDGFEVYLKNTLPVVETKIISQEPVIPAAGEISQIALKMGLTQEDIEKYGPKEDITHG